jgi:hypothetical protein
LAAALLAAVASDREQVLLDGDAGRSAVLAQAAPVRALRFRPPALPFPQASQVPYKLVVVLSAGRSCVVELQQPRISVTAAPQPMEPELPELEVRLAPSAVKPDERAALEVREQPREVAQWARALP